MIGISRHLCSLGPVGGPLVMAAAGLVALLVLTMGTEKTGYGLPQYAARAARTCDNCHVDPTGWVDPPLADRRCSLACTTCHVDPAGGGARTVAGYYYGIQTLSALGATRRPWNDRSDAERAGLAIEEVLRQPGLTRMVAQAGGDWPGVAQAESQPTGQPVSMPSGEQPTTMPSEPDDAGEGQLGTAAWGTPAGYPSVTSFEQGRYGGLNPDPLIFIGADFRFATYFNQRRVLLFPMQTDLSVGLHPVEHLTLLAEVGLQGSQTGVDGDVAGEEVDPVGLHEVFLMTHEWPYQAYLKVGRMQPPFGTRLDDHTAPVRRMLGLDPSRPSTYVSGVEIGAAPNYPYLNAAVFRLDAGQYDFYPDNGTGFSGVAGWRDLAWGGGGSFWVSQSDLEDRVMGGLTWYLNPWRWLERLPLTYLGEVDLVHLEPADAGRTIQQLVAFHELDWAVKSGLYVRLRYDFEDPDLDVEDDHAHRLNLQLDLFPYKFTEIQLVGRYLLPASGANDVDFLMTLRAWY